MGVFKKYIGALHLAQLFYITVGGGVLLFVLRFFYHWLGVLPYVYVIVLLCWFLANYFLLFVGNQSLVANRIMSARFSNGDENEVQIIIKSNYSIPLNLQIIDEIPHQFQRRDVLFQLAIAAGAQQVVHYQLRPVKRGVYGFGNINVFASCWLGLMSRKWVLGKPEDVAVYPSYLQMRKYQLMAISNRLSEVGVKKIRRFGHSSEFEQIKEYVQGDDYRTLNWKATARKGQLMVNTFSDEKSQQVYCIIDKSRVMKMPFDGLSLLDYAINAALVLSNVALMKQDKAGLITFSHEIGSFLKADKKAAQMQLVLDTLYSQKTRYLESSYERLYSLLKTKVTQRSLLVLFTNFESMGALQRQLPYLIKMATQHLLVVVFFENTALDTLVTQAATTTQAVYTKIVAEQFVHEKKLMVKELNRYGILALLAAPKDLTVNALNKYVEIKARNLI